jgi:hypothetical protein
MPKQAPGYAAPSLRGFALKHVVRCRNKHFQSQVHSLTEAQGRRAALDIPRARARVDFVAAADRAPTHCKSQTREGGSGDREYRYRRPPDCPKCSVVSPKKRGVVKPRAFGEPPPAFDQAVLCSAVRLCSRKPPLRGSPRRHEARAIALNSLSH